MWTAENSLRHADNSGKKSIKVHHNKRRAFSDDEREKCDVDYVHDEIVHEATTTPYIYMTASSSVRTWSEVVRKSEGRFLCNDIANLRVISNYARVCAEVDVSDSLNKCCWCCRRCRLFIPSSRGEWLRRRKKSLIFVKCFNTLLIPLNGNRNFHRHALENFPVLLSNKHIM